MVEVDPGTPQKDRYCQEGDGPSFSAAGLRNISSTTSYTSIRRLYGGDGVDRHVPAATGRPESLADRLDKDPNIRIKMLNLIDRDVEWSQKKGWPIRQDLQNARQIIADHGVKALFQALDAGKIALPAVLIPMLAPLLSGGQTRQEQGSL